MPFIDINELLEEIRKNRFKEQKTTDDYYRQLARNNRRNKRMRRNAR